MTIYLAVIYQGFSPVCYKAFTDKQSALLYYDEEISNSYMTIRSEVIGIELVTDQFMEQILQTKEPHEINTNSSL